VIHPDLASRMPSTSLEEWRVGNCAEFNACNTALLRGARLEDLVFATVRAQTGVLEPPCLNCQWTLYKAKQVF